jgi:hypothetical protein
MSSLHLSTHTESERPVGCSDSEDTVWDVRPVGWVDSEDTVWDVLDVICDGPASPLSDMRNLFR